MTENATSMEPGLAPARNPGSVLAKARESQHITQQEVAERLNLRVDVIKALESGNYDDLPGETFVRGYLRGYARLLDVDEEDILEPREYVAPPAVSGRSIRTRSARPRVHRSRSGGKSRFGVVLLALIALIVATWTLSDIPGLDVSGWLSGIGQSPDPASSDEAVVASGQFPVQVNVTRLDTSAQNRNAPSRNPALPEASARSSAPAAGASESVALDVRSTPLSVTTGAPVAVETATTPIVTTAGSGAGGEEAAAGSRAVVSIGSTRGSRQPGDAPANGASTEDRQPTDSAERSQPISLAATSSGSAANSDSVATTEPRSATDGGSLVVMSGGTSWVDIRDATGKRLVYETLHANEIRQLVGRLPFRMVLGNAPAIRIQLNGTTMDSSAYTQSDRTARFSIGADGVSSN